MKRFALTLAFLLATFMSTTVVEPPRPAYADDGSGCRSDQPYIEQIYGDINVR